MFVLFGFDHQIRRDHGPAIPIVCPNCHNATHLRLIEIKKWFTLFMIPIFPYDSDYLLVCDVCSRGIELDDEQFERAQRVCRAARAYREERISKERFEKILDRSRLLEYTTRRAARSHRDE